MALVNTRPDLSKQVAVTEHLSIHILVSNQRAPTNQRNMEPPRDTRDIPPELIEMAKEMGADARDVMMSFAAPDRVKADLPPLSYALSTAILTPPPATTHKAKTSTASGASPGRGRRWMSNSGQRQRLRRLSSRRCPT